MRTLARNKQFYYFALYQGKQRVTEDGVFTGEYETSYSDCQLAKDNISASKGAATDDVFGINLNYSKSIVTAEDRKIDEYSVLWLTYEELAEIGNSSHTQDDLGLYQGRIYKCTSSYEGAYDGDYWELVPHTHKVVGVAKSLNSITYAIREVDIDEED